jgi:hypothetical protein
MLAVACHQDKFVLERCCGDEKIRLIDELSLPLQATPSHCVSPSDCLRQGEDSHRL